jgi:hypothetical protein
MKLAVLVLTLALVGCAAKKPVKPGVTYYIDPPCLTKPIKLEQCDLQSPPNCKVIRVNYKPKCERLALPSQ